eukprot:g46693.t1
MEEVTPRLEAVVGESQNKLAQEASPGDRFQTGGWSGSRILDVRPVEEALKTCAPELDTSLAKLFRYSYNHGIYPTMLKIAQ